MNKTLKDIQSDISIFCKQRDWYHKHPNELISSITIELGELAEHYQWKDKFEDYTEEEKKEIGYEFVDILFYLSVLANNTGIDMTDAFYDKLPKLAKKFPEKLGRHTKEINKRYRKEGKNRLYE